MKPTGVQLWSLSSAFRSIHDLLCQLIGDLPSVSEVATEARNEQRLVTVTQWFIQMVSDAVININNQPCNFVIFSFFTLNYFPLYSWNVKSLFWNGNAELCKEYLCVLFSMSCMYSTAGQRGCFYVVFVCSPPVCVGSPSTVHSHTA